MKKMKMITENWKAIEEIEENVREKTGDQEAGFNSSLFYLPVKDAPGRRLLLSCQYRNKKGKKGQEIFSTSYKDIYTYAKYCPFTGKPLYEEIECESDETTKE